MGFDVIVFLKEVILCNFYIKRLFFWDVFIFRLWERGWFDWRVYMECKKVFLVFRIMLGSIVFV